MITVKNLVLVCCVMIYLLFFNSCDKQEWSETKKLHHGHSNIEEHAKKKYRDSNNSHMDKKIKKEHH